MALHDAQSVSCPTIVVLQHGRSAIHRAAKQGNLGVVKLLLQHGADIDATAKVPRPSYTEIYYAHTC